MGRSGAIRVTSLIVVPAARFELAIFALKGRCPRPLDDAGRLRFVETNEVLAMCLDDVSKNGSHRIPIQDFKGMGELIAFGEPLRSHVALDLDIPSVTKEEIRIVEMRRAFKKVGESLRVAGERDAMIEMVNDPRQFPRALTVVPTIPSLLATTRTLSMTSGVATIEPRGRASLGTEPSVRL